MYVKSNIKERAGSKFNMKGILLDFDTNCVAEISDINSDLVKTMKGHPFKLEILDSYDPNQILINEKTKELEKLKVAELKELALLQEVPFEGENGKDLLKAEIIANIVKSLI